MNKFLSIAIMLCFVGCANAGSGASAAVTAGAGNARHQGHRGDSAAENACRKAVADELGGKLRAQDLRVIDAKKSKAGTTVRIEVPDAEAPWACDIEADGTVKSVYYTAEG